MRRCIFFSVVFVLSCILTPAPLPAQTQNRVPVPGTRISFIIPAGFALSEFTPVYIHSSGKAALQFSEVFSPPETVAGEVLSASTRFKYTMRLSACSAESTLDSLPCRWMQFSLDQPDGSFDRIENFIAGDSTQSLCVQLLYSSSLPADTLLALRASIASVRWNRTASLLPTEFTRCTLTPAAPLSELTGGQGNCLIYGLNDGTGTASLQSPILMVRVIPVLATGTSAELFQKMLMNTIVESRNRMFAGAEPGILDSFSVDGLIGYETLYGATALPDNIPVRIYRSGVFHPRGMLLFDGIIPAGSPADWNALFQRTVRSLKRKRINPREQTDCAQLMELGNYDGALECFEVFLARSSSIPALLGKADALRMLRRHTEALDAYKAVLDADADVEQAWIGRGRTLSAMRRYRDALPDFDRAIALNAHMADVYADRALAYLRYGNLSAARHDCERALALAPRVAPYHALLGETYQAEEDTIGALREYSLALELDSLDAATLARRGLLYKHMERYPESLIDLSRALMIDPHRGELHEPRARILLRFAEYREACVAAQKALAYNADDEDAHIVLALARARLEGPAAALETLTDAIQRLPSREEISTARALFYLMAGKYKEASADFRRDKQLAYNSALRVCLFWADLRLYQEDGVRKNLQQLYSQIKVDSSRHWYFGSVRFALNALTEEEYRADAASVPLPRFWDRRELTREASFVIGMYKYVSGRKIGAAKDWKQCLPVSCRDPLWQHILQLYVDGVWK